MLRGIWIDTSQTMVCGNNRVAAQFDGLFHGFIRGVRNVDEHAQPVHFFDNRTATFVQAMPFGLRTAGVGELIGPVVGRKLRRSQTEFIELAQHVEIPVEIEPSFEIENGSDLSSLVDAFDIVSIEGKLNRGVVRGNLLVLRDPASAGRVVSPTWPDSTPPKQTS